MLPANFRLGKTNLDKLYRKGKNLQEEFLLARFLANNVNHPRFAVIIPKKIAAKATQRNRLKRITLTIIRKNLDQTQTLLGRSLDLALTFKKLPTEDRIEETLTALFKKIGDKR